MDFTQMGKQLLMTAAFCVLGLVVLALAYWLWDLITPYSIRQEIGEKQNVAVAVVLAGVLIGMSIIIAGALLG